MVLEISEKIRFRVGSLSVSVNKALHSRTVIVFTYVFILAEETQDSGLLSFIISCNYKIKQVSFYKNNVIIYLTFLEG